LRKFIAAIVDAVDGRDLMLWIGLGLLAYGLWPVWHPGAFIIPGAVLAGVAIFGVR
jgi:hypothetical protein